MTALCTVHQIQATIDPLARQVSIGGPGLVFSLQPRARHCWLPLGAAAAVDGGSAAVTGSHPPWPCEVVILDA
jgi:hypothetical protein